jgi:hypothetical protein
MLNHAIEEGSPHLNLVQKSPKFDTYLYSAIDKTYKQQRYTNVLIIGTNLVP